MFRRPSCQAIGALAGEIEIDLHFQGGQPPEAFVQALCQIAAAG